MTSALMGFLISLIAFSGILIGKLIAYLSDDEIKQGNIYFHTTKKITLFAIFVFLALTISFSLTNIVAFIAGLFLSYLFKINYSWLGLGLASSLTNPNIIIISTLIFIHGLTYSALNKSLIKEAVLFSLPFTLLLTPISNIFLASLASGAILSNTFFGD